MKERLFIGWKQPAHRKPTVSVCQGCFAKLLYTRATGGPASVVDYSADPLVGAWAMLEELQGTETTVLRTRRESVTLSIAVSGGVERNAIEDAEHDAERTTITEGPKVFSADAKTHSYSWPCSRTPYSDYFKANVLPLLSSDPISGASVLLPTTGSGKDVDPSPHAQPTSGHHGRVMREYLDGSAVTHRMSLDDFAEQNPIAVAAAGVM
ncbi:hypothetical protein HDU93_009453 [Gonapodya sp. JEL0774]|nr:hypothetical protein HDU93_009453 [Gonapodya sp. JEL0774]